MKKLFLFLFVLWGAVFFFGCSVDKEESEVESLTFKSIIAEADNLEDDMIEIVLRPDYELRTLTVSYDSLDGAEDGVIGGDFFERFEDIIDLIEKDELVILEGDDGAEKGAVTVVLKYDDGDDENYTRMFSYYGGDEAEGVEQLADYYADLRTLFTQDVY